MVQRRKFLIGTVGAACAAPLLSSASQGYPDRPIKIIVGFNPGGGIDVLARKYSPYLIKKFGVPIVVENKPGAAGNIASGFVASAPNDGYTLLWTGSSQHGINPTLYKQLPFDPIKDFSPVALMNKTTMVLIVNNNVPAKSMKELLAFAKRAKDPIAFGSAGSGSTVHLSMELMLHMAGVQGLHVPYKGGGAAMPALLAGEISMMFENVLVARPFIESGQVRALGVTSDRASPTLPNVPAIAELVPGYSAYSWSGILAPKGCPPEIVTQVNRVFNETNREPEISAFLRMGASEVGEGTPADFGQFIKSEIQKWAQVIEMSKVERV